MVSSKLYIHPNVRRFTPRISVLRRRLQSDIAYYLNEYTLSEWMKRVFEGRFGGPIWGGNAI